MSENSLANLVPGQKPGRDSGRALLVAAIAAALAPDFAGDDSIRFQLAKVWDFEVTPAVRAYVVNAVAERVLNALIAGVVGAPEGGRVVAIERKKQGAVLLAELGYCLNKWS